MFSNLTALIVLGDFPGLNIKSLRDLVQFISHESLPSWLVVSIVSVQRSGFISIYYVLSRFASVQRQHSLVVLEGSCHA